MSSIVHSIDVSVPVRAAYDQWTQFEEFPRFMDGVERVVQVDDTHVDWTAEIAGQRRTWRAEITEQEPDMRVAWRSVDGAMNAGVVTFHHLAQDQARVTLQLDVEPEGAVDKAGDALGFVERQVEGDLRRFKTFIEERGAPTGAWRGRVDRSDAG
jgi:uncharacterized membrane protein